jgi:hypothetical protein
MALRRGEDRRAGRGDWVGRVLVSGCAVLLLSFLATEAFATVLSDQELTRTSIHASAYSVAEHYRTTHTLPGSLVPLRLRRRHRDTTRDAWGHPLFYRKDGADAFRIGSLGADGAVGGRGDDADIEVRYRIGAAGYEEEIPGTDAASPE